MPEALDATPNRVEIKAGKVILRSLKKRRDDVFPAVPLSMLSKRMGHADIKTTAIYGDLPLEQK